MNVAFIPVRGGSKSIPLKNIKKIHGYPLVYWTVKAAVECQYIDKIYVSTDNRLIKDTVLSFAFPNVEVISRSPETASDTASTESAMLEFANQYEFENIVLIQATSPLLTAEDLDGGFVQYHDHTTDSVLSVVRQKRFIWKETETGTVAENYNPLSRPRRQEYDGYLVENGAFYITSRKAFIETGCRISGNIRTYEMSEDTYFEIDEPSDWIIIEEFLKRKYPHNKQDESNLSAIKMFLSDCDGCLTDGGMYYSEAGDELKKFNTKDGMGISNLKNAGLITGIITGENSEAVRRRAEKLHIDEVFLGVKDKLAVAKVLCEKYNLSLDEIVYIGDDINDLELIKAVGFGCAVSNAMPIIKDAADYVTAHRGGDGAIREVTDIILSARKKND